MAAAHSPLPLVRSFRRLKKIGDLFKDPKKPRGLERPWVVAPQGRRVSAVKIFENPHWRSDAQSGVVVTRKAGSIVHDGSAR